MVADLASRLVPRGAPIFNEGPHAGDTSISARLTANLTEPGSFVGVF
jgi:hypothetical protein